MKTKQTTQLTQIALIGLLAISINTSHAKTFSTVNLVSTAISEDCLDYCVDGACFWLVCSLLECSVKTTPHINHNLPDFVVSSYNEPGNNSFLEAQPLDLMPNIQGGHLSTKSGKQVNSNLKFKEVSVIGNPVAYAMGKAKYLCSSKIDPYMPYYLSTLDETMWRSGLTELLYPSTWIPGMNEVGSDKSQAGKSSNKSSGKSSGNSSDKFSTKFLNSWGSLYPRIGFLNQTNEVKAASVIAARGLEIVNEGGARIYQSADCTSQDCMKRNGQWQMVSPIEENRCRAFGTESVKALQAKVDDDGQYGWTAWRNYGCCIPRSGMFIGSSITGCLTGG